MTWRAWYDNRFTDRKPCSHRWEPSHGSPWGTIIGVSKCLDCGATCRSEDFQRRQPEIPTRLAKEDP